MKLKIVYPNKYENEKRYIVETVFRHFLKLDDVSLEFSEKIAKQEVHIICEDNSSTKKLVLNNVLFNFDEKEWLTVGSLPLTPIEYFSLNDVKTVLTVFFANFRSSAIRPIYHIQKIKDKLLNKHTDIKRNTSSGSQI